MYVELQTYIEEKIIRLQVNMRSQFPQILTVVSDISCSLT